MADIRAFRGYRYDLGRVGSLSDVVAPPYDVIDESLQQALYDRSPYNAVRLELPRAEGQEDRYALAARTLKQWIADDVLRQDGNRSLYIYEQQFNIDDKTYTRRGFFCRVRLESFTTGRIFPHEQTLSGPKADRLKLYQATGFNISPIFGLYPDSEGEIGRLFDGITHKQPPLEAADHLGVINRMWVVSNDHLITEVVGLMGGKPLFIADGHHRYETGLKYLEELKASGEVTDDEHPANYCLMMLVSMADPGLIILPTHRLVTLPAQLTMPQLEQVLSEHFEISGEYGSAADAWQLLDSQGTSPDGTQPLIGFGTAADQCWRVFRLKDPHVMDHLAADHSPDWRCLAVSILHTLVFDKLFPEKLNLKPQCQYVHKVSEVIEAIANRHCSLAALVPSATMPHVQRIAGNREKMPPKSTYFYPKILTGMVFNSLKND